MKSIKFLFMAIVTALAINANAQEPQKMQNIFIIEGYFFNEIPVDMSLSTGLISINTANGTQAYGIILKEPLTKEAKQYAIPKEQIPESDILLEMFNEKQSNMINFSLAREEIIKVGDVFPEFSAHDINGKEWNNTDIEGKIMVLNCWFTGCGPCRAEMSELSQWKLEMPDVLFFSATYESTKTALPVLEKTGFNWIHLVDDRQFKEYIGTNGYPMTVIVDKDGKIVQIEYGTSPMQRKKLKESIESLR